jgi:threonine dehydratase
LTFPVLQYCVDDILTVDDAELAATMSFLAGRMKIVVEPTGCLGAAAVLGRHLDVRGKRIGIVLSGGNVDLVRFAGLIQAAAERGKDPRRVIPPGGGDN